MSNTPLGIPNVVDIKAEIQINKHTNFQRRVRRLTGQRYPTAGTSVSPNNSLHATATVNGHVASSNTRASKSGVTSKGAKTAVRGARSKKVKVEHSQGNTCFSQTLQYSIVKNHCCEQGLGLCV